MRSLLKILNWTTLKSNFTYRCRRSSPTRRRRAGQPFSKTGWAEAVGAGGQAFVVYGRTEVAGGWVGGDGARSNAEGAPPLRAPRVEFPWPKIILAFGRAGRYGVRMDRLWKAGVGGQGSGPEGKVDQLGPVGPLFARPFFSASSASSALKTPESHTRFPK